MKFFISINLSFINNNTLNMIVIIVFLLSVLTKIKSGLNINIFSAVYILL